MHVSRPMLTLLIMSFLITMTACGDDDDSNGDSSNDNGDQSLEELAERLDEFVDACADWHGECVGGEGVGPEPYRDACEDDFNFHLDDAVDPAGCIDARLAEWECLRDPCPSETDELLCVEESADANDLCKSKEFATDPPPGSDTPTVDESEFVDACTTYLDVCDPDDGFSTEQDCENMWTLDLANAANPGSCVDLRTESWECFVEEDCGDGNACMNVMMEMAEHCQY